ncbi:MAG: type I polyketide synthase [Myxococcota bacterium]
MSQDVNDDDIAIVGLGLRVPGAWGHRAYWRNLREGIESIRTYTDEELIEAGEARERLQRSNYVRAGAPLEGMELFDPDFFRFSPKEAAILDPQHRHFLEVSWEALEDAGHPPERFDGPVGVFAGCGMGGYFFFNLCSHPELLESVGPFLLRHTGNDKDFLATRLSHVLDLTGPSLNIQTACSTSLVTVHAAVQSLLSRECDMALAGGVTIELPHRRGYLYEQNEILSPDGHCHAFDHRAAGTVFGSGCGVVVLRRLADALADDDHVYAVIRATAVNNDGARKAGYLAPSVDGQASAVVEALSLADVSADRVGYVECHGTGTHLGDPIEVAALTQAFRETTDRRAFCRIGSVKTNIGHLDTAAGVASLIKAALALHHGEIPPSLGFEAPNPSIPFDDTPFVVNDRRTPWPRGPEPRMAGVNSLGVGGTNAHVLLEEAPDPPPSSEAALEHQPLVLSARRRESLDEATRRLAEHLRAHPEQPLADVAWTLHRGRRAFDHRRVLVARDHEEAARVLEEGDPWRLFTHRAGEAAGDVVFMYPGGGAQHAGMARGLYESEPVFRRHVDEGLAVLRREGDHEAADLLLGGADADSTEVAFRRPSLQLPAILIVEYALTQLWRSWGVEPAELIGHSMGENAAACVAGVLAYEDAIRLVRLRGRLFDSVPGGGMLGVPLSPSELAPLLCGELELACVNGPELCVASGPRPALEALEGRLAELGVDAHPIAIDIAAHSRMLDPILDDFRRALERIDLRPPQIPIVSNLTGEHLTDAQATDPDYWVRHLRSTVRFADGLVTLSRESSRVYLEVGPGRVLASLARQHPGIDGGRVLGSLRHPDQALNDQAHHLQTFARLWACGARVDFDRAWAGERRRRVSLPTYAFLHERYFIEPADRPQGAGEEPLAKTPDVRDWGYRPTWRRSVPPEATDPPSASWLVFLDDAGLGRRIVARLRARGDSAVTVEAGDTFAKHGPDAYTLSPEAGREGYDALVRDLVSSGRSPSRIAHLWLVTADESFRPGSSFFHRNQERGFYSLFFLAQAIEGEGLPRPLHLTVISNGMQQVGDEALPHPEKATVLGPCRVVPRELTGVTCASVDVQLPAVPGRRSAWAVLTGRPESDPLADLAAQLEEELLAEPTDAVVAYRGVKRWVREHVRVPLDAAAEPVRRLRDRGVYLITGGFGGIGAVVAETLARRCRARLVLVGRRELPPRDRWDAWLREHGDADPTSRRIALVRELEALGAQVHAAAVDVTNLEQMRELVASVDERFGAVHGVVHAAGVIDDAPLSMKDLASVEDVFAPKVHGTLVLDRLFRGAALDFFLLFSSTSTITAPAGQVDYVAANAFLEAFADARSHATTVQWGMWSEVGMAAGSLAPKQSGAETPPAKPAASPLLDRMIRPTQGRATFETDLAPETHWVVQDHRTASGQALLPGTGYLELAAEALAELGEEGPFEVQDLLFMLPLRVPDVGGPQRVRVSLVRSEEGYGMHVRSACERDGRRGWQLHAEARLSLVRHERPWALDFTAIEARCGGRVYRDAHGLRTGQERHLRFGPRWRVLQEVRWGGDEAVARLALPEPFGVDPDQGFRLHPALLDLATGFAMELVEGYDAERLWIPVSYAAVRVFASLPARIRSWARLRRDARRDPGFAVFDVVIADDEGNVLVEVDELVLRQSSELGDLTLGAAAPSHAVHLEPEPAETSDEARLPSPQEDGLRRMLEHGIRPSEGADAFVRALDSGARRLVVSSIDLDVLLRETGRASRSASGPRFTRPRLDTEYLEPRDDVERTLVGLWQELLGVEKVGVRDSFFDLGGHSLIAVRLFARIKQAYRTEFPISALFEAPTIERCASLIREALDAREGGGAPRPRRYKHLVAMHPERTGPNAPFFLVAGMFGNVLNLRHLAHLLGGDRPFYGLQARGLYGDEAPHETFEEMAEAYLSEIRSVQAEGPYMLGGFSGGGITAYEMARQLHTRGERVSLLAMLDTPLPHSPELTWSDRAKVQREHLREKGPAYVAEWAAARLRWEAQRIRNGLRKPVERGEETFHDEAIEAAFRRAVARYQVRPYPGDIVLFRPAQHPRFVLGPGRVLDDRMQFVFHDNGWGRHARDVEVHEVPGDHDSMVLEPNVRVLAARLASCIERAEGGKPRSTGRPAEAAE